MLLAAAVGWGRKWAIIRGGTEGDICQHQRPDMPPRYFPPSMKALTAALYCCCFQMQEQGERARRWAWEG